MLSARILFAHYNSYNLQPRQRVTKHISMCPSYYYHEKCVTRVSSIKHRQATRLLKLFLFRLSFLYHLKCIFHNDSRQISVSILEDFFRFFLRKSIFIGFWERVTFENTM